MVTRDAFRKWLTTHINGHTAAVYQVNKYWQSAVSWTNSGMPSFTCGLQWKKMVEDTNFDLSLPHLESDENMTSKSSSTTRRKPYCLLLPWEHSINTRPWKVMYLFCSNSLHFAVSADELMLSRSWSYQLLWKSRLRSSQEKVARQRRPLLMQHMHRGKQETKSSILHCFYQSLSTSVKPKPY